jgi:hypothetical protein
MIYHQYKCIYIHIPKTGGKSVNNALGLGWPGHKDISQYASELNAAVFQSYFKFSIVRNPWARLVSEYNFQKNNGRPKKDKLFIFDERGAKRGFTDWVKVAFENPHHYTGEEWAGDVSKHIHRWSPQVDWISVNGKIAVDFIARLENISEDFAEIRKKLGLPPAKFPWRNAKWHWHYSDYYDEATREAVTKYYARDIEAFGYRYEERSRFAHLREQLRSRLSGGPNPRDAVMREIPTK